jgi:hypothetical protein
MGKKKKANTYADGGLPIPNPNSFVAPISGINPGVQRYNLNTKPLDFSQNIQVLQNAERNDILRGNQQLRMMDMALRKERLKQEKGESYNVLRRELFKSMKGDMDDFQKTFGLDPNSPKHQKLLDGILTQYNSAMKDMFVAINEQDPTKAMAGAAKLRSDLYKNEEYLKEAKLLKQFDDYHKWVDKESAKENTNVNLDAAMDVVERFRQRQLDGGDWDSNEFNTDKITFNRGAVEDQISGIMDAVSKGQKKVVVDNLDGGLGTRKTTTLEFNDPVAMGNDLVDMLMNSKDGRGYLSAQGYNLGNDESIQDAKDNYAKQFELSMPGRGETQTTDVDEKYKAEHILKADGTIDDKKERELTSAEIMKKRYDKSVTTAAGQAAGAYVLDNATESWLKRTDVMDILQNETMSYGSRIAKLDKILKLDNYEPITDDDLAKYNGDVTNEEGATYESFTRPGSHLGEDYIITNNPDLIAEFPDADQFSAEQTNERYGVGVPEIGYTPGVQFMVGAELAGIDTTPSGSGNYYAIPESDVAAYLGKHTDLGKAKKQLLKNQFISDKIRSGEYSPEQINLAARFLSDEAAQDAFFEQAWLPSLTKRVESLELKGLDPKVADKLDEGNIDAKLYYLAHHHEGASQGFLKDWTYKIEGNRNAGKEVLNAWDRIDEYAKTNPDASIAEIVANAESRGDHMTVYEGTARSSAITKYQILFDTHQKMIRDFMSTWEGRTVSREAEPVKKTITREEMEASAKKSTTMPSYMNDILNIN